MNNQNHMDAKKRLKLGTCFCPVCEKPRQKGNHTECSRITQLKGMTERGELNEIKAEKACSMDKSRQVPPLSKVSGT
jgi:hypothetical protein